MRNTNSNRTQLARTVAAQYNMKGLKTFQKFFVTALADSYKQDKKSFKKDAQIYMKK